MKSFLFAAVLLVQCAFAGQGHLLSTKGLIAPQESGLVLPHEHIFTDLRGPTLPDHGQADTNDVIRVMEPLLRAAKEAGVSTIVECTTIGVGRNVPVVAELARRTGLNIIVPTGVYGRANFAPQKYAEMTEDQLADWMIKEIAEGIEGTGIRAGFIKTAASENELKPLEEKFLRASARASRATGVAIASHTTSGVVARKQADVIERMNVPLHRFVWVHAQAENNPDLHVELAKRGVYIELDSVGASPQENQKIVVAIQRLIAAGLEDRILISHDAGWYNPGQPNGGKQRGFTALTSEFIPLLKSSGLTPAQVEKLTKTNPFRAFALAPM